MTDIAAYAPGHITGIFYIDDLAEDPLKRGSLGAGFSIDTGAKSIITPSHQANGEPVFTLNGAPSDELIVSHTLYHHFIESLSKRPSEKLHIAHRIDAPQGSGFGTSGAGALSLALALNRYFDSPYSEQRAAEFAHMAEIECKTGLGTVIGEYYGGFEIRNKAGAPGIGEIEHIPFPDDLRAVFAVRGPYSTSEALADDYVRENVNRSGRKNLAELQRKPSVENFLYYSRQFAVETGLLTHWVEILLNLLAKKGIVGSMLMFGEAIFTLVNEKDVGGIIELLRRHTAASADETDITIFSTSINTSGGTYL